MRVGFLVVILSTIFIRAKYINRHLHLITYVLPLAFLGYFYNETASFNHIFFSNFDNIIADLEFSIFGLQPSVEFSKAFHWAWFSELMNFGYFSYYLLIIGVPVLFFYKRHSKFQEMLFVLLSTFYMFYILFIIFPVVGPQFYFLGDLSEFKPQGIFGNLIAFIQEEGEVPTGAFPSSHVGVSLLLVFYIYKYFQQYFILTALIVATLIASTVYIKAHYVLDVFAAFIVTPLLYFLSKKLYIYLLNNYGENNE